MLELLSQRWWKYIVIFLLLYVASFGFFVHVPGQLGILDESIRNLFFHVPMWFTMLILFALGVFYSVKYLIYPTRELDIMAYNFNKIGMIFCFLGLVTGMIWANYTWGKPWVEQDPKLKGAAVSTLMYSAYFILRKSTNNIDQSAKLSAIYNIIAFAMLIPLLFILPNMNDTLHPGNGGNAKFSSYDIDNNLRLVFYPAILGWIGLGIWISGLFIRFNLYFHKKN